MQDGQIEFAIVKISDTSFEIYKLGKNTIRLTILEKLQVTEGLVSLELESLALPELLEGQLAVVLRNNLVEGATKP